MQKMQTENRPAIFNPYTSEPVLQHSYATASSIVGQCIKNLQSDVPLYRQA